ncbi:hypothetical protein HRI_004224200 [Hibiscus trionum]|uniref:RING-type domain-containing protein n=1 Tax=Hibiscus trionum TaxID=183268 RepID=A0A9W7J133_HIBTR|nr:hypothetical protein HRI_004224200 [Hibiscus trionum]
MSTEHKEQEPNPNVDADLALARTLQEQERAYMMLSMNNDVGDYGSWETGSYLHYDDFDDLHGHDVDDDDDDVDVLDLHAQSQVVNSIRLIFRVTRLMLEHFRMLKKEKWLLDCWLWPGLVRVRGTVTIETRGNGGIARDRTWEEVDPDELSYEELLALGEAGNNDSCVICHVDYDEGDSLTALSCKHSYHPECINNWLKINKICPVCSAEVST